MSGTVGALLGGVADALGAASGGDVIVLGNMVFTDFAIPERVTNGGPTQVTIHKLPGGARVLDTMGDDPVPIAWSGVFIGPDAAELRGQLEQIQIDAQPVDLFWGERSFLVLLAETQFEDRFKRIEYRVSCIVLPNEPEDDFEDDADYGNGDTPQTQTAASDQGQSHLTKARTAATARTSIPVPPIPPDAPARLAIDDGTV